MTKNHYRPKLVIHEWETNLIMLSVNYKSTNRKRYYERTKLLISLARFVIKYENVFCFCYKIFPYIKLKLIIQIKISKYKLNYILFLLFNFLIQSNRFKEFFFSSLPCFLFSSLILVRDSNDNISFLILVDDHQPLNLSNLNNNTFIYQMRRSR